MATFSFLGFSLDFTFGGVLFKICYYTNAPLSFFWLLCDIGVAGDAVLLLPVPALNWMLRGTD